MYTMEIRIDKNNRFLIWIQKIFLRKNMKESDAWKKYESSGGMRGKDGKKTIDQKYERSGKKVKIRD